MEEPLTGFVGSWTTKLLSHLLELPPTIGGSWPLGSSRMKSVVKYLTDSLKRLFFDGRMWTYSGVEMMKVKAKEQYGSVLK